MESDAKNIRLNVLTKIHTTVQMGILINTVEIDTNLELMRS